MLLFMLVEELIARPASKEGNRVVVSLLHESVEIVRVESAIRHHLIGEILSQLRFDERKEWPKGTAGVHKLLMGVANRRFQ